MTTLKQKKDNCINKANHTPCPSGYLEWDKWSDKMSETHNQKRCPECGLWVIWEPKENMQNAND